MDKLDLPEKYLNAAQEYANQMLDNISETEYEYKVCVEDFLAGAKMLHEEILLMKEWFNHIEQLATDKKTANGFVMSDSDTFDEIRDFAKRCQEYIEIHNL